MPAAWTLLVIFIHLWHGSQSISGKLSNSVTLAHHEELHVFGMKSFRFLFPVRFPFIFYLPYFKRATYSTRFFFPEEIFNFLYERTRRWNSLTYFPRGPRLHFFSAPLPAEILRIFPRHATQNWLIDWIAKIIHLDSRERGILGSRMNWGGTLARPPGRQFYRGGNRRGGLN